MLANNKFRVIEDLKNTRAEEYTMKRYEVEFKSTTYRAYLVDAVSKKQAERFAYQVLEEDDWKVSEVWKENAEVQSITEISTGKNKKAE